MAAFTSLVSIHAPRAGRDITLIFVKEINDSFNPRAPCGTRQRTSLLLYWRFMFQSTRPVRDATSQGVPTEIYYPVSIHAPRAGRDYKPNHDQHHQQVSIHAPRAGRDDKAAKIVKQAEVSIHAPRAGRDEQLCKLAKLQRVFNPRAPCGTRQQDYSEV